jgi:hypothetical protein
MVQETLHRIAARPPLSQPDPRTMAVTITLGRRPQRRVPTSRMLSSIFLKMLRGGFAPSGYRPTNDQPIASRALLAHLDMLLTTADLIRSARAKASRFPMTLAAPRLTSETPTSARRSSIQMACFPSSTADAHKEERRRRNFPNSLVPPKHLSKTSQVKTDTHHFLQLHTQMPSIALRRDAPPPGGGP